MKTKIVYQSQEKGCGYAAVKMALIHMSKRKDFAYAEEPEIEGMAPSLLDIKEYALNHGLSLEVFRTKDPSELLDNKEYPLLLILNESKSTHMVYLERKRRKDYVVYDPKRGKRYIPHEDLHRVFSGTFVSLLSYRELGQSFQKKKDKTRRWNLVDAFFSFLPLPFLLLGMSTLEGYVLAIPITFFLLSLTSVFIGRFIKIASFKAFDRNYGRFLLHNDPLKRRSLYTHYCQYKAYAFTSLGQFAATLAETIGLVSILAIRNLFFGTLLCLAILMSVLLVILDTPREKKTLVMIEEKEDTFLNVRLSEEDRKTALLGVFASSTSYASFLLSRETFTFVISVAFSSIAMAITGLASLETFIFYCLSIHIVVSLTIETFKSYEGVEKKRKEEPFFLRYFVE